MKISELPEAPMPNDDAVIAYDFVGDVPRRNMPIGEYLRRHKPVYTHRNGETEVPTAVGAYWFKGTYYAGEYGDSRFAHDEQLLIGVSRWDWDEYGLRFDIFASDEGMDSEKFVGQWWGPITPPWETNT